MISDARRGHVSPGIYTEEKDVTYSVKSLGITSLGLVGETLYGPAFEDIEVKNWGEFVDYFGGTSPEKFKGTGLPKYELPYVAKSYLEESKELHVVRVLGLSGYHAGPAWSIETDNGKPLVILRSKMTYSGRTEDECETNESCVALVKTVSVGPYTPIAYDSECVPTSGTSVITGMEGIRFSITVSTITNETKVYNVSMNPSDNDYIYKVLSSNPETGTTPVYIEAIYENSLEGASGVSAVNKFTTDIYDDFREEYRCAITPWIVSEVAAKEQDANMTKLFRFYTISDGDAANYQVKVSIQNIRPKDGLFDVVVRDFNDYDAQPVVLEKFSNCSLAEGDASYIAFKIGTVDGGYVSKSKYIAVEMADAEDLSNHIPAGFVGYPIPAYGKTGDKRVKVSYYTEIQPEIKPKRQYFGINEQVLESDIFSYKGKGFYGKQEYLSNGFHLDSVLNKYESDKIMVDGASGYSFTTVSRNKVGSETKAPRFINADIINSTIYADVNNRKFTVCFYGGFDGWDVNRVANGFGRSNTDIYKASKYKVNNGSDIFSKVSENGLNAPLNLPSTAITSDYYAYLAGYRVFANPQDADINLFATPGIDWLNHSLLTEEALDVIEDADDGRGGDALYIMNAPMNADMDEVADLLEGISLDSSYAATYFPWVMYYDASNRRYIELPVTKDVVRNMAATDNNAFPWFAPAGMERGEVRCVKAVQKTTLADEDTLYEGRINPVKTFAKDGVKIWGNKTIYTRESPLNRVNVRRLMIRVKKLISEAASHLIFEQYDDTLEKQFRGLVEPILADVKANRGIYDYRVQTEVTEETRDQHILPAKILIKPTPALEYISISFVVYPQSVEFSEN